VITTRSARDFEFTNPKQKCREACNLRKRLPKSICSHRLLKHENRRRRRSFQCVSGTNETDLLDVTKLCNTVKQASSTFTTKVLKSKDWFIRLAEHLLNMAGKSNEAERALQTGERTWVKILQQVEKLARDLRKQYSMPKIHSLQKKSKKLHGMNQDHNDSANFSSQVQPT
jgi:hypothetical protein